jgi:hypothetical protein
LLARDGSLEVFATGAGDACDKTMLELAGFTRPLGACAQEPSVAVDLGGRVVVVHAASAAIEVGVAEDAAPTQGRRFSPSVRIHGALRTVHATPVGASLRGFSFGAGERRGAPVVVVLDVNGDAVLAPIDPRSGTLGAEERLRSLRSAELGSNPACAPQSGEARVVLPFDGAIAFLPASLPGVYPGRGGGVAVLRWTSQRACIDALEIPVRDERFDEGPGEEGHGVLGKIVARFDRSLRATLVLVGLGSETRQRLACTNLAPKETP